MIATRLNQPEVSGITTLVTYRGQRRRVFTGDVIDHEDAPIKEVRLQYPSSNSSPRVLRIFRLKNGDAAFRVFGSGFADTKLADRLFDTEAGAMSHLNKEIALYCAAGWYHV